ncbi:MAG: sigma 54-interacting transcriptional regulator, partial [Thermotaleaceae bacterium]
NASLRKYGGFVTINCAAIPKELLEAELFGYESGAFTGAKKEGKLGKFEMATGGSILLDEIGSMPMEMQAKLLRVLDSKEFERVGGNAPIQLDARIIAATNENLEESIRNNRFRQDLYYRLNVIRVDIPPLRDRREDIPLLAEDILKGLAKDFDAAPKEVSPEALALMGAHSWPGNIRELRNILERAVHVASGEVIEARHLPEYLQAKTPEIQENQSSNSMLLKDIVAQAEIEAIGKALEESDGNRTQAAKRLGIHRTALYKKMEAYGMKLSDLEK